jgi:hypothetical protein
VLHAFHIHNFQNSQEPHSISVIKVRSPVKPTDDSGSITVQHKIATIAANGLKVAVIAVMDYLDFTELSAFYDHFEANFSSKHDLEQRYKVQRDLIHRIGDESLCARKKANVVVLAMPMVELFVVRKLSEFVDSFVALCLLHDKSRAFEPTTDFEKFRLTILNTDTILCSEKSMEMTGMTGFGLANLNIRVSGSKTLVVESEIFNF